MGPKLKTLVTHLIGVAAGGMAVAGWTASHAVDLYAAWNSLNVIFAEIAKFVATVTPLATAAYAVYRTTTKQRLEEIAADPKAVEVAKELPVTPQTAALADALKSK